MKWLYGLFNVLFDYNVILDVCRLMDWSVVLVVFNMDIEIFFLKEIDIYDVIVIWMVVKFVENVCIWMFFFE